MPANIPNKELTTSEKTTLRAMRKHIEEHNTPPSYRQLCAATGFAIGTIQHHLRSLKEKGYVTEKKITSIRLGPSLKGRKVAL
jgi:SOS-response transcriptional repressor LexA